MAWKPDANDWRLIRGLGIAVVVGPLACFLGGLALKAALAPDSSRPRPVEAAAEGWIVDLLELHNRYRIQEGLPPLAIDPRLSAAAHSHAEDMANRDKMEHKGVDGSTPADRATRTGYRYTAVGENVAMGQSTPADAALAWYNSPPHRRNILGDYTQCGFGRSSAANGTHYWCTTFGTPASPR